MKRVRQLSVHGAAVRDLVGAGAAAGSLPWLPSWHPHMSGSNPLTGRASPCQPALPACGSVKDTVRRGVFVIHFQFTLRDILHCLCLKPVFSKKCLLCSWSAAHRQLQLSPLRASPPLLALSSGTS